jgi:hypothetical protein
MKTFSLSFFSLFIVISGWSEDRPNIIILLADDLGWADLGYQGSEDIVLPTLTSWLKTESDSPMGMSPPRYAVRPGPV